MKNLVSFFEIPAIDFMRAVKFYESLFNVRLEIFDCAHEKMGFFPTQNNVYQGSISWSSKLDFRPSEQGVLISLYCDDMEESLSFIKENGGKVLISKTKIESPDRGWFAVFIDCEGNRVGLYSDK